MGVGASASFIQLTGMPRCFDMDHAITESYLEPNWSDYDQLNGPDPDDYTDFMADLAANNLKADLNCDNMWNHKDIAIFCNGGGICP